MMRDGETRLWWKKERKRGKEPGRDLKGCRPGWMPRGDDDRPGFLLPGAGRELTTAGRVLCCGKHGTLLHWASASTLKQQRFAETCE